MRRAVVASEGANEANCGGALARALAPLRGRRARGVLFTLTCAAPLALPPFLLPGDGGVLALGGLATLCASVPLLARAVVGPLRRRASEARQCAATVVAQAMDAMVLFDADGRLLSFNRAAERMFRVRAGEVLGRNVEELIPDPSFARYHRALSDDAADVTTPGVLLRVRGRRVDGVPLALEGSFTAYRTGDGVTITGVLRDISARLRAEEALRRSEASFRALIEGLPHAVLVERDDRVVYANGKAAELLGAHAEAALTGGPFLELFDRSHRPRLRERIAATRNCGDDGGGAPEEHALFCRDGGQVSVDVSLVSVLFQGEPAVLTIARDLTEHKQLQSRLVHLAFHDGLTGLANRELFHDRVAHAVERARRSGESLTVVFLDLDGFKSVNDSLGHDAGDRLLAAVARRMTTAVRRSDTVARLGGDEFALLLEATEPEGAIQVVERALAELRRPFDLAEREVVLGASAGVASSAGGELTPEELLQHADRAMYRAKGRRIGGWEIHRESHNPSARERSDLEIDLRRAVERGELRLLYQPIVALETSRVVGVEALLRWMHPRRGLVSPATFIPLAERSGAIVPIGAWVLDEACRQLGAWRDEHDLGDGFSMSLNLSARQLSDVTLVERVRRALERGRVPPRSLVLELTESEAFQEGDQTLERLRGLGVRFALDDFGTGHASLGYLRRFPLDILKIDRSFVRDVTVNAEDAELVRTMIDLGSILRLVTVAEGIETPAQLEKLRSFRCALGQGYHFARPLEAEQIAELLHRPVPDPRPAPHAAEGASC